MTEDPDVRAAQIKQIRRGILDLLNLTYPQDLTYETICGAFVNIDAHYIRRDLSYLEEKGYIEWCNRRPNAPWRKRRYQLTASGVEIADKINTDPALSP